MSLQNVIPLYNVEGRLDHLSFDSKNNRLLLASFGNNSLEVIDLNLNKQIQTIRGFKEPQGVAFVPEFKKVYVTNGENGEVSILDYDSFNTLGHIKLGEDADNIHYNSEDKKVYVGCGESIFAIDAQTDKIVGQVNLNGHPESFQLEEKGSKIFVNVPGIQKIVVIDKDKQQIVDQWPFREECRNFPMAIDESHQRLFVGCRNPGKLVIFDIKTGQEIAALDLDDDSDDLFYDSISQNIYASCGEGAIDVYKQGKGNDYRFLAKLPTAFGARTSLLNLDSQKFFLAVPLSGKQQAEIRIYKVSK